MTGMPAGETARIRDDDGNVLLTYRSFAGVVGIVASLVASIVALTGFAAAAFLVAERHPLSAAVAFSLGILFGLLVLALVPRVNVTLFDGEEPVLTVSQRSRSSFPAATFAVVTADGRPVASLRQSFFARIGRNAWVISDANERAIGRAVEESLGRAILRKVAGKFSRAFQCDVRIDANGKRAGMIIRRQTKRGEVDVLECTSDLDRRVAVALALLILGREP